MSFDFFQNSTEEPAFQTNWNLSKPKKRGVKKKYKVKFCEEGDLGFFLVDAPQKKMEKSVFFLLFVFKKQKCWGAKNFTHVT